MDNLRNRHLVGSNKIALLQDQTTQPFDFEPQRRRSTMGYKVENINEVESLSGIDVCEQKKSELFKPKISWFNVVGFSLLHLAGLYGWYLVFAFKAKLATTIFVLLLRHYCGLSITLGAHRLWSHRSYKAKLPLRLIYLIGQTISGQNCLWVWVRDHRQHHKYSDTDGDPHNSTRGFFFCHIGWLLVQKHPEVIAKGKQIDMRDLSSDPWIMFQKRYYKTLYVIFAIILPTVIPWYFWGETLTNSFFVSYLAGYIFQLNATWAVNSVAHMFGTKPYNMKICPVESSFVSFFGLGEGWHNYHHTFPWDCHASEYGKYFNLSSRLLDLLERWELAYDLKMASKQMIINKITKHGDGTHPIY